MSAGSAPCPFCAAPAPLRLEAPAPEWPSGPVFSLYECAPCATGFISPPPRDGREDLYFSSYYGGPGALSRLLQGIFMRGKAAKIERLKARGSMLDFGCGSGEFLAEMARRGWDVRGVEPSASARGRLAEGARGRVSESVDALPPGRYDVITLWHVLEHVPDPAEILAALAARLEEGGVLFTAIPNAASWESREFGARWFHLDLPRHRSQFSPEALRRLLARAGLEVAATDHFSWAYNVFGLFQTLLNACVPDVNFFYRRLKRGAGDRGEMPAGRRLACWLATAAAAPAALAAAVLLAPILGAAGSAGTVEMAARRHRLGSA